MNVSRLFLGFALLPLIAFGAEALSAPPTIEGVKYVKSVGGIAEYTLESNGLQILLMPEHSAPVLTFMVTYRVGSRNEVTGTTGATHLLEHLMFKGTPKFLRANGTGVDQLLEKTGAVYNATTWLDRTNYYENIDSSHLALAVELEADRMRNLLLKEEDRKPEMTVVRNEFERGENSPIQSLIKEIFQAAYVAHPYHHSTIGWRSDIEKVSIAKLREFYDTFYWPDNSTVSVIGDFKTEEALSLIKKFYGVIPRAPKEIPQVYTEEPNQTAPRRVGVKRSGQLGVVGIGYKVPAATHADYPALSVLSNILTDGKNSRMYRALTDKNLTTSVSPFLGFNRDPSLYITFALMTPGSKHEEVEKIMLAEIDRIKKDGVTEVEVATAISKLLADAAFERDGSFAIAGNLNECIAAGDWTLYYNLEDKIKQVTAADIKRVTSTYLIEDHSTTGWFTPIVAEGGPAAPPKSAGKTGREDERPADGPYYYRAPALDATGPLLQTPSADLKAPPAAPSGGTTDIASKVQRARINDIDLVIYRTGVKDVVTFRGSIPVGDVASPRENIAIATLTGALLDKGTVNQDKFAISQKLESVGASLTFSVRNDVLYISGQSLRKDVPLVISLLAEQLRTPAFSAEEFEKIKKQIAGSLKRALESPDYRAREAFGRVAYPVGHPNHQPGSDAMLAAVESATLDQIKAFHASHYGPAHFTLVTVGDLDPAQIKAEVGKSFAGWTGGKPVPAASRVTSVDAPKEQTVFMPDKPSVSVVLGQPTKLKYSDPEYLPLRVATAILGSGFTGRLMANVRDKEGLTYGISSSLANDTYFDGDWRITATFAPALLDKGLASTHRQLQSWYEQGVTPEELERRKSNLIGSFKVNLATTGGLADQLLVTVQRGFDLSWMDQYPQKVAALTPEQVNGAVKKYLKPESMVLIRAGTVPNPAAK